MKKILCLLLALSILLSVTVCGRDTSTPDSSPSQSQPAKSNGEGEELDVIGDIDVDSGLFNVTLTVPADFIGEVTQEQLDESAKGNGYKSATLNDDGSVTYIMTKVQH